MKYFVADPSSETGIRQLTEDKITIKEDDTLEYIHPESGLPCRVEQDHWSTDWDKTVIGAYERLTAEIGFARQKLDKLLTAQQRLVDSSPSLQRRTNQMKLF